MARDEVVPWSMARTRPLIGCHAGEKAWPGAGPGHAPVRKDSCALLGLRPALHELVIGDRLALRLLVLELGGWAVLLAEPFGRILRLVESRTAAAIGVGLLVGSL